MGTSLVAPTVVLIVLPSGAVAVMTPVKSPSAASGGLKVVVTSAVEFAGTVTVFALRVRVPACGGPPVSPTVNMLSDSVVSTAEVFT